MLSVAIGNVIRIVTGGTIREEWALLVRSLLIIAGALVDLIDPAEPLVGDAARAAARDAARDAARAAQFDELAAVLEGFHAEGYGASDAAAIDPATIMVIVQLVLTLIEKLRKK